MHLDAGSLVCGFMLGVALCQLVIGVALLRRGTYQPRAWANLHLSPRSQGQGFLLISATFALAGLGYLVATALGAAVLVLGLITANLYRRRVEHRTHPEATTHPVALPPEGPQPGRDPSPDRREP